MALRCAVVLLLEQTLGGKWNSRVLCAVTEFSNIGLFVTSPAMFHKGHVITNFST
jgi:hypothetical protein